MTTAPDPPPAQGQLDREAAEWCVRMHGEEREQWRPAFEEWLKRGALHLRAYNRIEEVYLLGGKLLRRGGAPPSKAHRSRAYFKGLVASAALAMTAVGLGWLLWPAEPLERPENKWSVARTQPQAFRLATSQGASQRVALRDGSVMTVAGGSSLAVAIDEHARRIDLFAGSAQFDVAHARRPFTVWAGGGSVTALGTIFAVSVGRDARVTVRLIEGRVAVRTPARAGVSARPALLEAGETHVFAGTATAGARDLARQPETVGELIDLANARAVDGLRIEIAPATLRDARLGGRFQVRGPASVAEQLAVMFDLVVDRTEPNVIKVRRR